MCAGFAVLALLPESTTLTRAAAAVLLVGAWFGPVLLLRRRALRLAWGAVSLLPAVFLALPARRDVAVEPLRAEYVSRLHAYDGVVYRWGGENTLGIDCSGLVRRALVDALVREGIRRTDPGPVRSAIGLWWDDCTARSLGEGHGGRTVPVLASGSLNALDASRVLPGDLAVTSDGLHVLAHAGGGVWVQASPGAGRVVVTAAPSADDPWFAKPVRVVRWIALREAAEGD